MFENNRPKIKITYSKRHLIIDIVSLFGVLSIAVASFIASRFLPERVPVHFDLLGNPDGFGTPREFLFWALVLSVVLFLLWGMLSFFSLIPRYHNYPVEITEENAARQYKIAVDFMYNFKIAVVFCFMCMDVMTIWSAFFGSINIYIFAVMIVSLIPTIYFGVDFNKKSKNNK